MMHLLILLMAMFTNSIQWEKSVDCHNNIKDQSKRYRRLKRTQMLEAVKAEINTAWL